MQIKLNTCFLKGEHETFSILQFHKYTVSTYLPTFEGHISILIGKLRIKQSICMHHLLFQNECHLSLCSQICDRKLHIIALLIKLQCGLYLQRSCGQVNTLSSFLIQRCGTYQTRSANWLHLHVPSVKTELGKSAFRYAAPFTWNNLTQILKLNTLVSLSTFRELIQGMIKMNVSLQEYIKVIRLKGQIQIFIKSVLILKCPYVLCSLLKE